jgi:hypothetical protein
MGAAYHPGHDHSMTVTLRFGYLMGFLKRREIKEGQRITHLVPTMI